ncbi:U2 small nuclear ribonucleoprotein B'', putative [Entamoeba invadens IP1]|uniref:U2 small nuclear ribonucleoprotein B'', putative n=1 Tax=Entamoeba invadens IP1 TaxID=370355 RepID=A0A0A1U044_ENTIV|nr:U2 small nuclear ribonucleoprotein B'', putative [Entamoeba invadens IP1]ELP87249.1 U2 small nuclear ribonucleoprotein B'', putative [Entamoeba invadens IP1]|eukprot:XP_004254020.1 U2 small nuclear ribonucleoprotein B'', putative [Entamoeba invadens IP1]
MTEQNETQTPIPTQSETKTDTRSATLYINNLTQAFKPSKLKAHLTKLFSPFGVVLTVQVRKARAMRGQAFVVYNSMDAAEHAFLSLQDNSLFGRPMHIAYAKTESDAFVASTGRKISRVKKPKSAELKISAQNESAPNQVNVGTSAVDGVGKVQRDLTNDTNPQNEQTRVQPKIEKPMINKILFIENVPKNYGKDELIALYTKYSGFSEVRYIKVRGSGVAFIEFRDEQSSEIALNETNGKDGLVLQYAKK